MSNADFAAAISSTQLTEAQKLRLIAGRNLTNEELALALSTNTTSTANAAATATTFSLTGAWNSLGLALKGVWAAMLANPITTIITLATTAIAVISQVKHKIKESADEIEQKASEAASSIESISDELQKTSKTVDETGKRFAELSQGVDSLTGKNVSLTTDEYKEFLDLSNQLAEIFPTLTRHYDENGNAIVELSGDIDTIVGSLQNLIEIQRQLAYQDMLDNLPDLYKGIYKKSSGYKDEIESVKHEIDVLDAGLTNLENNHFIKNDENWGTSVIQTYNDNAEQWGDSIKRYRDLLDDIGLKYQEIGSPSEGDYNTTYVIDWSGMSDEQIETAQKQIENGFGKIKAKYNTEIKNLYNQINATNNKNKANWNELTQSINAWLYSDSSYIAMSDEMKSVVQSMINNVDFSELSFKKWEDVEDYIIENVLEPIAQATPEAQEALRGLFDIDFATATLNDYFNAIKPYLTTIALALGKTEEEIAAMFGLTDQVTNFNALVTKRNEILDSFVGDHTQGSKDAFANWLDGLSAGDLEIVYKISTEYTSEKVKDQLEAYQDGGEVNLFLRPKVDNSELKKAGWDVSDDGYATVFTGTYSNTAGTIAANFTPIITDENGAFKGVLSPDKFTRYCEDVLDGVREDDLKLQIGAIFDGENAIEEADKAAGEIHILQDYLYDLGDPSNFNLDKWAYALNQFKSAATEPLDAFNTLLNDKGTAKDPHFIDRVDKYIEKINKLNSAYKKLSEGDFSNEDFDKLIRDFPTLATRADDLGLAINELKDAMNSEMDNDFADQFGKMNTDADVEALEAYKRAILSVGETVDLGNALFAGDSNKTQKIINNASKVQTVLNSQKSGQSISLENFNSDEFKDYKEALEYVNGAVQLNKEKVVEITKVKAKEQIAINKSNKAMSQAKYLENARQITILRKSLEGARTEQEKLNYQTKIDSLVTENENIAEACKQYDFLSKSLQEATDSYQHWLNAQNASDFGDMMSDTENAIKLISDTLDETSDIYGQIGSKKYQAALDLIIPDSVDRDNINAVKQYMTNLKNYFYFDEDGAIAGMDIQGFIQKALNVGLMTFDSANQEYKIAGGKTMESFAEGLKLSSGMVQAFFDEMQLYGGKFDWSDEIGKSIDELYAKIEDINNLPHFKDITLKLDFSDIPTAEGQIKAIDTEISKIDKIKATPNIDASEIEYANDILLYLIRQKQSLEAPAIMDVDVSNVDSKYQEAISLAQEYQQALNDKEILTKLGFNTDDTDKKLTEVEGKIQKLDPKIKAELKLDTTNKDGIVEFIKNFDPNKYPKIVKFKADTKEVDDASEEVSKPIDRNVRYHAVNLDSLPDHFSVIVRKVRYEIDGDTDVSGHVNGTAHASGTAKAGGDWGTARGGRTLVGELGREIIVDPRTGRWYTVGDNGAQFVDIPKGSIVFNHIQSKSLLENGYVSGRASALASGTALVTGAIGFPGVQASTVRKNRIEAEIAKAAASELSDSTPDGGDNNAEDSFKYIDRVEILLDRIHRKIDAVKDAISDVFSLWSTRGDNITKQIGNITDEIETQQAAARRYLEEARKQIDKYGLDPEWVKDIESGGIGFSYLTNLDELHEGYLEYQKWFEKYLDSRDTIAGLERDLSQLYKDQFDNIKKSYDNQIDLSEYLRDSEEKTYTQSTEYFDDMRDVYSKNLELLTSEAKDLEKQLQKAVDSDAVEVGSEAWQEMKKDINSVTKEIAKTNVELAKLYTEQFDYIQSNYQNQISSYESLHDANEKNFTTTTNYYKEMREISNKTLKAQRDELADLKKEFDEAMASGRIEEGSEAWYKMREAIDSTKRGISATRVELKQLYLDEFSYIQDGFKNQLSLYEYYSNVYQKKATIAETQGYMESGKALAARKNIQIKNTSILREELVALEKEFTDALETGKIQEGSDAWYSMQSAIKATKEAIYDSRIEVENLNKAMRELKWEKFNLKQSTTGQVNEEADFLINMMEFTDLYDEKGRLTDTGLATMGLHNLKADVYKKQSSEYLKELTKVELALYDDPDNVELLNRKQELLKLSRETAIAMENEQKAIISMVENGIKLELDSLKELIDTYKTALDSQKDLYDYQKTIADKSKNIAAIQKQLSAYTNDNSEETKATVQKLKVDLSDAQTDLQETEYNRSISDQKKLLDDIYTEYESFLNTRLDDTNKILEDMRMVTNAIPDRIGEVLRDTSLSASIHISTEMNGIWNEAAAELQRWNENAEAQQQITRDTLNAADASWGSFGDALRGSVVDKYSETNENINGVGDKADNIKTAVDMNAHGIETVFNDLEHQSGQIVANADSNADSIKDEIYKRDNTTTVQNGFTTTNDALKKISETVEKIEKKAEEMVAPYLGDVDLDDDVTSADSLVILRSGVGLENLSDEKKKLADIDGDGEITAVDALLALRTSVGLEKKTKAKSYSSGGLVDYTGIANVHGSKSNPEYVLSARDTQNFIKLNDILREAMRSQSMDLFSDTFGIEAPTIQFTKIPSFISGFSAANQTQDIQIINNIEIDHVENYDDFVRKLQTDTKFENMIHSMTIGKLNGGRSIDKYKYKW